MGKHGARNRAGAWEWMTFGQAMRVAVIEGLGEVIVGGNALDLVESVGVGAGVGVVAFGIRGARRWWDGR